MAWFSLRDSLLHLVITPATALLSGLSVAVVSFLYRPLTTAALTAWLTSRLPKPPPPTPGPPLAVLAGRGPEIAAATTALAAQML